MTCRRIINTIGDNHIGKVAIPDSVFLKPTKLLQNEYALIQEHVVMSYEMLKDISIFDEIKEIVRDHHEHYDGKGYPGGQKGDNIELGARILAVADSFDAMTTKRSYANALSLDEAIEELKKCSGTQFDPQVVEAFINLLKENPRIFSK